MSHHLRLPSSLMASGPMLVALSVMACSFVLDFDRPALLSDGVPLFCDISDDCHGEVEVLCVEWQCLNGLCQIPPGGDARDIDNDEFVSIHCGGHDCDDSARSVNPEAMETCNGRDDDCDGAIDEEFFAGASEPWNEIAGCSAPALAAGETSAGLVCEASGSICEPLCTDCLRCLVFAFLSQDGDVLDSWPIVSLSGNTSGRPAVAYSAVDQGYGVAWIDRNRVLFAIVGADGSFDSSSALQLGEGDDGDRDSVDVAKAGALFALTWSDSFEDRLTQVRFVLASSNTAREIAVEEGPLVMETEGSAFEPTITAYSGGVALAWTEELEPGATEIRVAHRKTGAASFQYGPNIGEGSSRSPDLVSHSRDQLALVFTDVPSDQRAPEIFFTGLSFVEDELIVDTGERLSNAAGGSDQPSITARDEGEIAVAWYDQRDGVRRLLLARLSLDGTILNTEQSLSDDPDRADFPALVSSASRRYLIGWRSGDEGNTVRVAVIGCPRE